VNIVQSTLKSIFQFFFRLLGGQEVIYVDREFEDSHGIIRADGHVIEGNVWKDQSYHRSGYMPVLKINGPLRKRASLLIPGRWEIGGYKKDKILVAMNYLDFIRMALTNDDARHVLIRINYQQREASLVIAMLDALLERHPEIAKDYEYLWANHEGLRGSSVQEMVMALERNSITILPSEENESKEVKKEGGTVH